MHDTDQQLLCSYNADAVCRVCALESSSFLLSLIWLMHAHDNCDIIHVRLSFTVLDVKAMDVTPELGKFSDSRKFLWVQSPVATLGFFFSPSLLTNVDEMKDLWCSSTVWLLSTQT